MILVLKVKKFGFIFLILNLSEVLLFDDLLNFANFLFFNFFDLNNF